MRILWGKRNGAIEKLPRLNGTPLPEFPQRAVDADPDVKTPPCRPRGVRHQSQLTVVARAGIGGGEDVISALRAVKGGGARRARAATLRPAAERQFDLPL